MGIYDGFRPSVPGSATASCMERMVSVVNTACICSIKAVQMKVLLIRTCRPPPTAITDTISSTRISTSFL